MKKISALNDCFACFKAGAGNLTYAFFVVSPPACIHLQVLLGYGVRDAVRAVPIPPPKLPVTAVNSAVVLPDLGAFTCFSKQGLQGDDHNVGECVMLNDYTINQCVSVLAVQQHPCFLGCLCTGYAFPATRVLGAESTVSVQLWVRGADCTRLGFRAFVTSVV